MRTGVAPLVLGLTLASISLAASSASAQGAKDPRAGLLDAYLSAHDALASDSTKGLKEAAAALDASAAQLPKQDQGAGDRVRTYAKVLEGAKDLAAAREAFKPLSEAMITLFAKSPELKAKGLAVFDCAMARGRWIQKGTAIRNPYYGAEMSTCGTPVPL